MEFYDGKMTSDVQETMLLLAEAYAVGGDEMIDLALETFGKLV